MPRPVVDVRIIGLGGTPLGCLVDTGAFRTRFDARLAELAGIDPDNELVESFWLGGRQITAAPAQVSLQLVGVGPSLDWAPTVWFCDPWPFPFQLLGLEGFLQHFRVTLSAYHVWVDCVPET